MNVREGLGYEYWCISRLAPWLWHWDVIVVTMTFTTFGLLVAVALETVTYTNIFDACVWVYWSQNGHELTSNIRQATFCISGPFYCRTCLDGTCIWNRPCETVYSLKALNFSVSFTDIWRPKDLFVYLLRSQLYFNPAEGFHLNIFSNIVKNPTAREGGEILYLFFTYFYRTRRMIMALPPHLVPLLVFLTFAMLSLQFRVNLADWGRTCNAAISRD